MTSHQKLWTLRLASLPAVLLLPLVCAMIMAALADLLWHDDFPLVETLLAFIVGLIAAIALSFRTVFARRDNSLRQGVRVLLGIAAFDVFGLPLAILIGTPRVAADRAGNKPGDQVRQFISAVDRDDYEKAASFFTKQSINAIQHNSALGYDFRAYCAHFKGLDSYSLSACRRGKGKYWNLTMRGRRNGEAVGYWFFFDRVGGKWLMVQSDTSYFWNEPREDAPHAKLQILTYRDSGADRNDFPPGANPNDITVLVHRIDGDRAIPSHPVLAEGDGSFRCRISPGIHGIEYEEIKGKLENQVISYSVITQVFEAGRSYVLSGYSIITNQ